MIELLSERNRVLAILTLFAIASITVTVAITPARALTPYSEELQIFTVIVSRYGFNGTASGFSITVQQGDVVKITFVYGDSDLTVDNPHAIMFDGYRIQTVNIGKSNPTVTVEFVADASGTFNFYCYVPCLGMENLLGHLIVKPSQNQKIPTSLNLAVLNMNSESNSYQISATVVDENGKPMVGVPVTFYENTTFGRLFLASVPTDTLGVAVLNFQPSRMGNIQILAENPGNAQYADSSKSILIIVASATAQTEGEIYLGMGQHTQPSGLFYGISYPPNLSMIGITRSMNILVVILAGIVVLGVWSTYAYVGRQIARIPKVGQHLEGVMEPYLPAAKIPADTSGSIGLEVATRWKNTLGLLFLVPMLGVADVLLVNALRLPIAWIALSLVSLAAFETVAIVALTSDRIASK